MLCAGVITRSLLRERTSQNTISGPRRAITSISSRPTRTLRATISKPRREQVRARHVFGAATQAVARARRRLASRHDSRGAGTITSRLRCRLHAVAAANAGAALLEHVHAAVAVGALALAEARALRRRNGTCSTRDPRRPSGPRTARRSDAGLVLRRIARRRLRRSACTFARVAGEVKHHADARLALHRARLDVRLVSAKPVSGTCSGKHGAPTLGVEQPTNNSAISARFRRATQTWHRMRWRFTGIPRMPSYPENPVTPRLAENFVRASGSGQLRARRYVGRHSAVSRHRSRGGRTLHMSAFPLDKKIACSL